MFLKKAVGNNNDNLENNKISGASPKRNTKIISDSVGVASLNKSNTSTINDIPTTFTDYVNKDIITKIAPVGQKMNQLNLNSSNNSG
jgi:hypothetical protein